jgi:hypothetical protein
MVSYLGLSNGDSTNNHLAVNQGQTPSNNTNQQRQDSFNLQQGQDSGQDSNNSWGGDSSSQFDQSEQAPNNNFDGSGQEFGNSNQQQDQFNGSSRPSGHNRGFDTTTGGT